MLGIFQEQGDLNKMFKVPKITKSEYGIEGLQKRRMKYYLYGLLGGAGLMGTAFTITRNPYQYISGMVLVGTSALGYVGDYKRQISFSKGFKGRKVFTFADGTKILADDKNSAIATWKKHHQHKEEPHKFELFHKSE